VVHFFSQNLKNRKKREKLERFVALGKFPVDFNAARLHSPPHTLRVGIIERIKKKKKKEMFKKKKKRRKRKKGMADDFINILYIF